MDKVEVHINYDEIVDEFTYGQMSDWTDFTPGAPRVTITADRAGFNYAIFDAVYPAPAGNDYYLVISEALVLAGAFDRTPVPDGGARVTVVQGSVALPPVNVTATGEDCGVGDRARLRPHVGGRSRASRDLRPRSDPGGLG